MTTRQKGPSSVGGLHEPLRRAVHWCLLLIARTMVKMRYRVRVEGLDRVARKGRRSILFLPNHPALVDPLIVTTLLWPQFRVRPVVDEGQAEKPLVGWLSRELRAVQVPDMTREGAAAVDRVEESTRRAGEALRNGDNVLFYPSGRLMRSSSEDLRGNSGVERLLQLAPGCRAVAVRTSGLWGSSFSRATGEPGLLRDWKKHLLALLSWGLFFMPRRQVVIEFHDASDIPRNDGRMAINSYLEKYYNSVERPNTWVPFFPWQGRSPQHLPEPPRREPMRDASSVSGAIRKQVADYLGELSGVSVAADGQGQENAPGQAARLTSDLGLDSLALVDLGLWLEREYGLAPSATDSLKTVADVMLAASGRAAGGAERRLNGPPPGWAEGDASVRLRAPDGDNIGHVFLNQARQGFSRLIVADENSGGRTYRDLITAVYALRPAIRPLEGEAVGIMLPASVGAVAAWLAVLFSGRVPAMVNWTVGRAHAAHCMEQAGVRAVLTSRVLLERLRGRGVDMDVSGVRYVCLEDLSADLGLMDKLAARFSAYFRWKGLYDVALPERAVILFTSGSEARPKGVPLSHANFLCELEDFGQVLSFDGTDRLLGMLPPFHSLGLAGTLFMPLVVGLPAVYHPDPTEGATLAKCIAAYGVTFTIAAPTFLEGILRHAQNSELESLRLAFTGAEKCPEHVYAAMEKKAPEAQLLEGYGVTECSPLISMDRPDDPRPGTIGKIIPSMEALVVHPETMEPVPPGRRGLLLVRGGNVFSGYLDPSDREPFVQAQGKRWYDTGDLVSMDEEGILTFRGRLGRFVKLGGEMISLAAVENVLLQAFSDRGEEDGPALAVEAGGTETAPELVLFAAFDVQRDEVNGVIRRAGLSGLHNIRRVERVERIPVLGTGKTDYKVLRRKAREE